MGFLDEFKRLAHPYEDEEEDNFEDDFDASPRPIERRERERAPRSEPAYSSPVMDELEARRRGGGAARLRGQGADGERH